MNNVAPFRIGINGVIEESHTDPYTGVTVVDRLHLTGVSLMHSNDPPSGVFPIQVERVEAPDGWYEITAPGMIRCRSCGESTIVTLESWYPIAACPSCGHEGGATVR